MKYLQKCDFTEEEIQNLEENVPSKLKEKLIENYKLVSKNITYLKNLGIHNFKEIFSKYYDMFLMDYSNFTAIFNKYDTEDLIEKLAKNMEIIEFL